MKTGFVQFNSTEKELNEEALFSCGKFCPETRFESLFRLSNPNNLQTFEIFKK